ncbi:PilT protein domain protein [uncultured Desulfobacterium sp.]|uniref:PilT protein domain protein n=1 Tax=uncultured Desulfobacterium sp. TaxID=201089 RepID=A0A445N3G3_9BACT|nr:PilT protein domain protein [uncultured Desulfobacterium sp.]
MEWINQFQGKTVGLDTAPLIYFIEENSVYINSVRLFFEAMDRGDFTVVTSTVTLLEVLIHPLRSNNKKLATEYRDILLNSRLVTLEISNAIAERAARLRAIHNIRTPDAIQIGAALNAGASYFFTNDVRLPEIPSIQIISLDAL